MISVDTVVRIRIP